MSLECALQGSRAAVGSRDCPEVEMALTLPPYFAHSDDRIYRKPFRRDSRGGPLRVQTSSDRTAPFLSPVLKLKMLLKETVLDFHPFQLPFLIGMLGASSPAAAL